MSEEPLDQRLMAAIRAHREATLTLQELASEFQEHCSRLRQISDMMTGAQDVIVAAAAEPPMMLPTVLQTGPRRGER